MNIKITVSRICPICKQPCTVEVSQESYNKWKGGMLIQQAMPELNPDEREAVKTGTHPECWEKLFGGQPTN